MDKYKPHCSTVPGAGTKPCSDDYRGKHAFSEVEVKNVATFLKSKKNNLKAYMDIHSYSQFWLIPWGYTKKPSPDHNELVGIVIIMIIIIIIIIIIINITMRMKMIEIEIEIVIMIITMTMTMIVIVIVIINDNGNDNDNNNENDNDSDIDCDNK